MVSSGDRRDTSPPSGASEGGLPAERSRPKYREGGWGGRRGEHEERGEEKSREEVAKGKGGEDRRYRIEEEWMREYKRK